MVDREDWLWARFQAGIRNADVLRQELAEMGVVVSLRTVERCVAPLAKHLGVYLPPLLGGCLQLNDYEGVNLTPAANRDSILRSLAFSSASVVIWSPVEVYRLPVEAIPRSLYHLRYLAGIRSQGKPIEP